MFIALLLAAASAQPVTIASKDVLLDFTYSWSAEAAAVPALNRRLRADAARERSRALVTAREDRKARVPLGAPWHAHLFARGWETAGQTRRLLSLEAATETYTGGAHGNRGTTTLLWDRQFGREIDRNTLLQRPGWWDGAIHRPFCILLDRERGKRRGEPVKRSDWPNQCPELKELTLTLEDADKDARFDHVSVTADPYVAGAYAEGDYTISLPITAAMVDRLKPEFRSSFKAQPPVQ